MRLTTVVYVCDRCGAERTFDGEVVGEEQMMRDLGSDGWCTVTVRSITKQGTFIGRQLCHVCVDLLSDHLDKQIPVP